MEWLYGQECLKDDLNKLEEKLSIKLPNEYINIVKMHDGAYPKKNTYDYNGKIGNVVQCLVSCKNEPMGILDMTKRINIKNIIPFMKDPFGNYICFEYKAPEDYIIVLWDHDTEKISYIADSFEIFINSLY